MKDAWYNNSPEEQEKEAMYRKTAYLSAKVSELSEKIDMLQNKSLISIIKERFNNWFFGTKG